VSPSKRFATVVLALGTVVLLAAIGLGQKMGYGLLGQSSDMSPGVFPSVVITPAAAGPEQGVYGPDWQRTQTLSAAPDPRFPDPRVPPVPLPTRPPPPTPSPKPATPTPNPNIPVWRQQPLPTERPSAEPSPETRTVSSPRATTEPTG
jgi:hypothetical protein